ncbi:hypothetical protein EHS25_004870 [Saitozyma podzolica]|uniref:Uncharacterized protein n=1 Tax=Saitozyma podzolica TaxID=1890683 RepID=A0A427Y2X5_9TREE|nr:hypothetical protein EHS25_004870 [Saitozyma podzolica]
MISTARAEMDSMGDGEDGDISFDDQQAVWTKLLMTYEELLGLSGDHSYGTFSPASPSLLTAVKAPTDSPAPYPFDFDNLNRDLHDPVNFQRLAILCLLRSRVLDPDVHFDDDTSGSRTSRTGRNLGGL